MKNILIIYTGGTIGMVKDVSTGALIPGGVEPIKSFVLNQQLTHFVDIVSTNIQIDSSDFNYLYITELLNIIEINYRNYDGILVLMGTDTMAYISSLVSYCISGLSKPIVFTGGQDPLFVVESDSKINLKNSIDGLHLGNFPNEVGVCFYNTWYRAVNVTKVDSKGYKAYN